MELKLLHLYGDVMNLYGEYANVSVLAAYLRDLGHSVSVDTLSLYEEKDISGYDFYYMGAGTERKTKLLLPRLLCFREALHRACDEGRVMLFTGTACDCLGRKITDAEGQEQEALGIGDFVSTQSKLRITGDCLGTMEGTEGCVVGFINKCSTTCGVKNAPFRLRMGCGNEKGKPEEGFRRNNCIGTHITGPLLVKNPHLLRYVAMLLTGSEKEPELRCEAMEAAYTVTRSELEKRLEAIK